MAVASGEPKAAAPAQRGGRRSGAGVPSWVTPLYMAGLAAVYLAQRVIVAQETLQHVFLGLGLAALAVATGAHFLPRFRAGGDRAPIERLLGQLSVAGLVGVALYFASTDWGLRLLGLQDLPELEGARLDTILTLAWIVLVAVSVIPMLFAEAALYPMRDAAQLEARRVRAAAAAGLSLALAAVYCSLFVYAASQMEAQADFSYFKTSEPGESTRKILDSFQDKIEITAFFPAVNEVRDEVSAYLARLCEKAPHAEFRVVDRYLEPKLAQELKAYQDGTIVFRKGDSSQKVQIGTEMKDARPRLKKLDQSVQEALYKLVRSTRMAYLTIGHGELNTATPQERDAGRSADLLQELLRQLNYRVMPLGLTQGLGKEVPPDAEIVFVLGPTEPFAPEEIGALKAYADRGGRLFMALDADSLAAEQPAVQLPAAPNSIAEAPGASGLEALAEIVGLRYSPALVVNQTHHVRRRANNSDRALLISNRFSSHASVSTLSRNASQTAVIFARSGSLQELGKGGFKVDMTLRGMPGTYADLNGNYDFDRDSEDSVTYYNLAAAVSRTIAASKATGQSSPADAAAKGGQHDQATGNEPGTSAQSADQEAAKPKEMRAFVLADADGISDLLLASFGPNRMLLADAVRWLGGEESFVGEVSTEEDVRIEHTKQKDLAWFYSTIFGTPAFVLAVGLWISRRGRRAGR